MHDATHIEDDSDPMAVQALITHERQARDRGWWSLLARCCAAESTIQTSWFDGTAAEYIELSTRVFDQIPSSHRLGRPVIDIHAVPADRYGVGRPAELTALNDDAYAWAGLPRPSCLRA